MVLLISKHMKQGLDLMDWNIHLDTFLRLLVYPIVYRSVSLCLGEFVSLTNITGLILEELAVEVLLTTRSCARSPVRDFSQGQAWASAKYFWMLRSKW